MSIRHGFGDTYLGEVPTDWRDAEKDLRRSLTIALILAATFELITRGTHGGVTVFGVTVTNLGLLAEALPIVIAYQAFAIVNLVVQSAALRAVHDAVMRALHPRKPSSARGRRGR